MDKSLLLDSYLKQLRLPMFAQHYRQVAEDAAQADLGYDHILLTLAEQEVAQRERNRQQHLIRSARLPILKELADFDFTVVPSLNKQAILDLGGGSYVQKAEPVVLVGHPGLGKTHMATGLALAICRQGYRVRFYTAAELVNDLLQAQDEHRLPRFLNAALTRAGKVTEVALVPIINWLSFRPSRR